MPQYEIYVVCKECGAEHPMRIRVFLNDGPAEKRSVAEAYGENVRPPQIHAVDGHKALCLRTGKTFVQDDSNRIFLVPC